MTSFRDCERELLGRGNEHFLQAWTTSEAVYRFTTRFTHQRFHEIQFSELVHVQNLAGGAELPFMGIQSSDAIPEIENHSPEFPFPYLFHLFVELQWQVPTFQQFRQFISEPEQYELCYGSLVEKGEHLRGYSPDKVQRAIEWTIHREYSRSFQIMYVAAWIREYAGCHVHYHLFADTQMHVNLWFGNTIISLLDLDKKLVANDEQWDWAKQFHVIQVDTPQHRYGELWVPTVKQLTTIVRTPAVPGTVSCVVLEDPSNMDEEVSQTKNAVMPDVENGAASENGASHTQSPTKHVQAPIEWLAMEEAAVQDRPGVDSVLGELGVPVRPRYSLLIMGENLRDDQAESLLRAGIKLYVFSQAERDWPTLVEFQQAGLFLYQVYRAADCLIQKPYFIVDGKSEHGLGVRELLEWLGRLGKNRHDFNLEQYLVEHAPSTQHLLVSAGAGTGKTWVMIQRIMYLLHMVEGLRPRDITMVTFTREATRIMRERLSTAVAVRLQLTGEPRYLEWLEDLSFMEVSTIPSFARRLLKATGSARGYSQQFQIRSFRERRRQLIREVLDEIIARNEASPRLMRLLKMRLFEFVQVADAFWTELHNKGLTSNDVAQLDWGEARDVEARGLHNLWKLLLGEVDRRLAAEKRRYDALDLTDLTRELQELTTNPRALSGKGVEIAYLFVDEFQDTDDVQIRLVDTIQNALSATVFVVGDIKQSIYRFRGATAIAFGVLANLFGKRNLSITEYTLTKNYRTSANLLDELHRYFLLWGEKGWLPYQEGERLTSGEHELGEMRVQPSMERARDEGEVLRKTVIGWIREARATLPAASVKPEQVAVLVRTNREARLVKKWCDAERIPCQLYQGGSFFSSAAIRDFQALVIGLLYPTEPFALANLMATPYSEVRVPWGNLLAFKGQRVVLDEYFSMYMPHPDWPNMVKKTRIEPILSVLRSAIEQMDPVQRYYDRELTRLVQREAWDNVAAQEEAALLARQYHLNLDKLMTLLHHKFNEEFMTLYGLHQWLETQQATNRDEDEAEVPVEERTGAVLCMSVHKAKGDEFHTVILPFTDRSFRVPHSELLLDEQQGRWRAGWCIRLWGRPGQQDEDRVFSNDVYDSIATVEQLESRKEETRLLYVALTRCKRRLWVVRYGRGKENWGNLLRV